MTPEERRALMSDAVRATRAMCSEAVLDALYGLFKRPVPARDWEAVVGLLKEELASLKARNARLSQDLAHERIK